MNWYKRLVVLLAFTAFSSTMLSCYGSFGLTKKIYKINGAIGGKLINSIVFWVFLIVPVYEIAFVADFFLLNVLEALTGNNPLAQGETKVIEKNGVKAELSSPRPGVLVVKSQGMTMEATESGAVITDESGAVVAAITPNEDGTATMIANGETKTISSTDLQKMSALTEQAFAGEKVERHIVETAHQAAR